MSSLPSSAAAVAAAASQRQEQEEVKYEVLYYERKNKVHKSKGVSKFDGILSIAVTSGYIRLQDTAATADNDSSDDDSEEEDAKLRGKAKEKQRRKHHQQQRKSKPVPYSGRDKALAQKCCDLQDDETIVLGGYEVQIVSSMKAAKPKTASGLLAHKRSVTNNNTLIRKRPNSLLGNSNGSIGSNAPTGGLKRGGGPLLSTTRKVLPKPLVSSIKSNTTTTTTKNNKNALPLARTIPPNTTNNTNGNNNPLSNRMIVAKPLVRRTVGGTSLAMRKQPPKQPQNGNKENNSNGIAPTTTANNINICPHIPMPASLRTVLRPHQVQGVEFLWNALTEGPQRGCILADEMVRNTIQRALLLLDTNNSTIKYQRNLT